jgi:hypothetical protein
VMRLTERHFTDPLDIHRKSAMARHWFARA